MRAPAWAAFGLGLAASALSAQAAPDLWLRLDGRVSEPLEVRSDHGYAAFDVSELARMGWEVSRYRDTVSVAADSARIAFAVGTPFFEWSGELLQLTDAPYVERGRVFVPVQFLIDFVQHRFAAYSYDPTTRTLSDGTVAAVATALAPARDPAAWGRASRVVVIDAGHGGVDPGAVGESGIREKDVAIGLARALFLALQADSTIEVRMTRDRDVRVPLWKRGEQATLWKGDRPGLFISLHANALPGSRATRGFETYFLSEARTDHERRVAALENAVDASAERTVATDELGAILGELRNHDYQHWSAHLAELIQVELSEVHPGPDRGVKQGPFAVITNALMPSVLVEIGYLTHRAEERLVGRPEFQEAAAGAIARAIDAFFRQYPGGAGTVGPVGPQPE